MERGYSDERKEHKINSEHKLILFASFAMHPSQSKNIRRYSARYGSARYCYYIVAMGRVIGKKSVISISMLNKFQRPSLSRALTLACTQGTIDRCKIFIIFSVLRLTLKDVPLSTLHCSIFSAIFL